MDPYTSVVTIEQPAEARTAFLRGLVLPNIGPAAAGPAGPAPTALAIIAISHFFNFVLMATDSEAFC